MRSRKDKLKLALIVLTATVSVHANAGEEAASTAPGGSGFASHMAKIATLKRETEELESAIKKCIEEKREADGDAAVRSLTLEIAETYKTLKESGEKLESETTLVRFHYPEQAEQLNRAYVRFKTKSLKELEGEAGIEGRLDRIHAHVIATFPLPTAEVSTPVAARIHPFFLRKPASVPGRLPTETSDEDGPEKIILKK